MYVVNLFVAVFILPTIIAAFDECTSKGQCTALDGVTCVAQGDQRLEKCNTYTCKKSYNVLKYKVVKKLLKCKRPDGTCMEMGVGEKDETKCTTESCRRAKNSDGTFTMTYREKSFGCPMKDGSCLLFGKRNQIRNEDKCLYTTCTRNKNKKGQYISRLKNKYYGCPNEGVCEDAEATKTVSCTTYMCVLSKRRTVMKWDILKTGCKTDEGCKYDTDEWPDLDASSCVTRRCDVTLNTMDGTYSSVNSVARHGCRASNGTCYYNGETWSEEDCYTRRCDVSITDKGESMAARNIESGICKDADGSCKGYGEAMKYQSGAATFDCVCDETKSTQGYPQGRPVCTSP
ncbi:uncharacterized protein LOC110446256 [Mizuhopecten yessoensis]|uniref:Uncharacterized protein n=1 Tax=Mizuhopecten yessoensis TaxID=6573 RepID=A0A210QXN9_MIZYE|nr:uncharacterized protein LOC110446256 [Mizuhopecten yessoensis]OWF53539.1 hypothetical protein KP79_PYT13651 [Mizuhopecten yessoensis]